jgi:hypothetical protein
LGVYNYRLDRTAIKSTLANNIHVFAALTHVNGKRNDLFAGRVFQPTNANGGIQTAGIRKHNPFRQR